MSITHAPAAALEGMSRRESELSTPQHSRGLVTAQLRLGAAASLVVLFLLGEICLALGLPVGGPLAVSIFLQFGPGVACALFVIRLPRDVFALLALVGGPAIVALVGTTAALTGAGSLGTVWRVLAGVTLAALMVGGGRALHRIRASGPAGEAEPDASWDRPTWWAAAVAAAGLAIALVAAAVHHGDPRPAGAAVSAGPLWFVGVLLVLGAVIYAWRLRASLAAPVLTLATVVVASQGVMYREPTAVVAARHLGLVDYILVNGRLDRSTDIYQAWAGLFGAGALNVQAAHIQDVFGYASWWGVAAAPLMLLVVRCVAGRFLDDRRAWLAALVFGLGSSLNTSFFAPQVFGFILAFTVLALLVGPTGPDRLPGMATRLGVVALLSVTLALTHQISPYLLALALIALAVFRLVRPWWAFLLPLVPAVGWALINRHLLTGYISVDAFGRLLDNLAPPTHDRVTFPAPLVNQLTFDVPAAALVVVGLLALLAWWRTRTRVGWGLAAAAASPVVLMAGTSYGQEGIFRVALFALPWLAILACLPPARPTRLALPSALSGVLAPVAVAALCAVNVLGLTGMDWARVVRSGDVSATYWVQHTAPTGSVVLSLGTDLTLPTDSTARYAEVGWISRATLIPAPDQAYPQTTGAQYSATADLADLTRRFRVVSATEHYAVVADSAAAYDERYGYQRYADHQKLFAVIAASASWEQVFSADGITVYRLVKSR